MSEVCDWTMSELGQALSEGRVSSVEATEACLKRAEATKDLGAYIHVDKDGALQQAKAADARRQQKTALGPLDGVPMGLKDIFLTKGLPTTCASNILRNYVAPYDGTAVKRLKGAGMVLLGKLNMDEFAMGSSNEHSAFGPVLNPWDKSRVPGGSSGGSAAAVSAGSSFASLGTDTGGSIRQPAALSGIVGLKPTYGRVSRYGVIAYASSLDQVGPMTKDVTDCATVLQAIAGHDPNDATSAPQPVDDYRKDLEAGVKGLTLGVPKEYFLPGIDPEVRAHVDDALKIYEKLGARLVEVSLPHTAYGIPTYYVLAPAEASSNLARYDGVRYGARQDPGTGLAGLYTETRSKGFGTEVQRRIILGNYVLSSGYYDAYYKRAQQVRTLVSRDFANAFKQVDALLTPTSPTPAFKIGENEDDPVKMYLSDVFTVTANLAGLPGLSLPCGFTEHQLPVGLQVIGAPWQEAKILRIARAYEREHDWHKRRPAA